MSGEVSIDGMAAEIIKELNSYANTEADSFEKIAREVAKEGAKKLKTASPRGAGRKGHYADGWKVKCERMGNGKFTFTIHNNKKPGLTHLLEKGHQLRQGGRARAIVHIKPVEEWCNQEFERRVKEELGR